MLRNYLTTWIHDKSLSVREVTAKEYLRYADYIAAHCAPGILLRDARPQQIAAIWAPLVRAGKLRSAQLVRQLIVAALRDAAAQGIIFDYTRRLPKIRHKPKTTPYIDPNHARILLTYDSPHKTAYALMCLSGLRRREAAELTWRDVDDQIHIRAAKTETGVRDLPISPQLLAVLNEQRKRQRANCLRAGIRWCASMCVITTHGQRIADHRTINKWLSTDCAKLGLPHLTPHMLRDTYATLAIDAGINMRVLQVLMGHAEISTTARYYAHVRPHVLANASRMISGMVGT